MRIKDIKIHFYDILCSIRCVYIGVHFFSSILFIVSFFFLFLAAADDVDAANVVFSLLSSYHFPIQTQTYKHTHTHHRLLRYPKHITGHQSFVRALIFILSPQLLSVLLLFFIHQHLFWMQFEGCAHANGHVKCKKERMYIMQFHSLFHVNYFINASSYLFVFIFVCFVSLWTRAHFTLSFHMYSERAYFRNHFRNSIQSDWNAFAMYWPDWFLFLLWFFFWAQCNRLKSLWNILLLATLFSLFWFDFDLYYSLNFDVSSTNSERSQTNVIDIFDLVQWNFSSMGLLKGVSGTSTCQRIM